LAATHRARHSCLALVGHQGTAWPTPPKPGCATPHIAAEKKAMPAPHGNKAPGYPSFAEYELQHNPGFDFLRMLNWCAAAKEEEFHRMFASYARAPMAVLLGAAAVEGYINYAGHLLVPNWSDFIKTTKTSGDKLKRIFEARGQPIELSSGIYQQTKSLLKFRGSIAHPRFTHHIEKRSSPPPTIFDHAQFDYPASKVLSIVEDFRTALLKDLKLDDLSWRRRYAEIIKLEQNETAKR
jgi:hypothetical protein